MLLSIAGYLLKDSLNDDDLIVKRLLVDNIVIKIDIKLSIFFMMHLQDEI
jgi:hypothetical protein